MILKDDILKVEVGGVNFVSATVLATKIPGLPTTENRGGPVVNQSTRVKEPMFILDQDALTGWTDGVSVKRTSAPRPVSWGDFAEPAQLSSRLVTISGTAVASSPQELHTMRDRFMGILVDGSYSEMSVRNASGVRYLTVGLEATPQWVQLWDTVAQWRLSFYAPNPRIYGPAQSMQLPDTTSRGGLDYPLAYPLDFGVNEAPVTVYNNGNVDAWPVFVITGDYFSGFKLTNGRNKQLVYTGMTTMIAPVTIDSASGTVLQGGQDRSTDLITRQWFPIPPGGASTGISPVFEPIVDGPGWCDIMYRDTYI